MEISPFSGRTLVSKDETLRHMKGEFVIGSVWKYFFCLLPALQSRKAGLFPFAGSSQLLAPSVFMEPQFAGLAICTKNIRRGA